MPATLPNKTSSIKVKDTDEIGLPLDSSRLGLDSVGRPVMAKAKASRRLGHIVKDALESHYGTLKAAAISLKIDQSQLNRQLEANNFAALEECDEEADAYIWQFVQQELGPFNKRERLMRAGNRIKRAVDDFLLEAANE